MDVERKDQPLAMQHTCNICGETYESKTKLYKHLCIAHGWDNPRYGNLKFQRVGLLIGWIAPFAADDDQDHEIWLTEERKRDTVFVDNIEKYLLQAIYAVENGLSSLDCVPATAYDRFPKGYSRCARSTQRSSFNLGIEPSTHGLADLVCMQLLRISDDYVDSWLTKVNGFLPEHITVHHRYEIPSAAVDFNAETSTTQRRYEIMLPLSALFPDNAVGLKDDAADDELIYVPVTKSHDSSATMDYLFPRDTPEGARRIEQFHIMKKVMKMFTNPADGKGHSKRLFFHNFVNGGITADETASRRRVDRFYHRQLMSFPDYGGTWVVFSLSGDDFLHGQLRRIVATMIAIHRGWLTREYLQAALDPSNTILLPLAPSWSVYFAECRYITTETKYPDCFFDPRRSQSADTSRIESWLTLIQQKIAAYGFDKSQSWLTALKSRCDQLMPKLSMILAIRDRSAATLQQQLDELYLKQNSSFPDVPEPYREVLDLLRQADRSGLWPVTSHARQNVINARQDADPRDYGSFSVGCLLKSLAQPKGNALFPGERIVAVLRCPID
jgi:tRNA pseudouridine(38-40) synthase